IEATHRDAMTFDLDAVQLRSAFGELVFPARIVLRARREHAHVMTRGGEVLGDVARVLLGAAENFFTVARHHERELHHPKIPLRPPPRFSTAPRCTRRIISMVSRRRNPSRAATTKPGSPLGPAAVTAVTKSDSVRGSARTKKPHEPFLSIVRSRL